MITAEQQNAHWSFHLQATVKCLPEQQSSYWHHQWNLPSGKIWLSIAKIPQGYILRFPEFADFMVNSKQHTIFCHPKESVLTETIQHLLLDQVLPLVLSTQGYVLLHASAIATESGIVAFAGQTGMGKSTLAANFAASNYALITDDCLRIEIDDGYFFGFPGYPGLRLWDESIDGLFDNPPELSEVAHYTNKKRLAISNTNLSFCNNRLPIRSLFFLESNEMQVASDIKMRVLSPREAFFALTSYTFKLDIWNPEMLAADFKRMQQIVASLPCYRLSFARGFELLPRVREAILEQVGNVQTIG